MNKPELVGHLERIDRELQKPWILFVFGSAALILLDEPDRTSLDIDVAGPYSQGDFGELEKAAAAAGVPINPPDDYRRDHIEWISAVRLCLSPPDANTDLLLWQGRCLTLRTVSIPRLIASKLIRYDTIDRSDIQYLAKQTGVEWGDVASAVEGLPAPFNRDVLIRENLRNLKTDMAMWREEPA